MTARLVARLQDAGLRREAGKNLGAGPGRQALLLELHPEAAYVVAVDVGTEVVHLLIADLHGAPHAYQGVPSTVLADKPQAQIVAAITDLVRTAVHEAAIPPERLAAVGGTITGIVDSERGVCLARSGTPGWENFARVEPLARTLGRPVILEETARAKAMAELRSGAARGARHFLYVDAGTAVGAGIVIDGQPFRGISGLAGEPKDVSCVESKPNAAPRVSLVTQRPPIDPSQWG
jgi:predicted NBD/HSP70 family sugar kinase